MTPISATPTRGPITAPAIQAMLGAVLGDSGGVVADVGDDETLALEAVIDGVDSLEVVVLVARDEDVVVVAASSRYTVNAFHPIRQP